MLSFNIYLAKYGSQLILLVRQQNKVVLSYVAHSRVTIYGGGASAVAETITARLILRCEKGLK
jgi:hypothetical protein